jgi:hypothetical protein
LGGDDGVKRFPRTNVRIHHPDSLLGSVDREAGIDRSLSHVAHPTEHVGVLWPSVPTCQVLQVVGHDDERSPRGHGGSGRADRSGASGLGELKIKHGDEVEPILRWGPVLHGRLDPGDLHAPQVGEPFGLGEADRREIDARHLPTLLRQPDRVAALATGKIYGPPGTKADNLSDEELVGRAGPHQLISAVALVPLLACHHLALPAVDAVNVEKSVLLQSGYGCDPVTPIW